MIPKQDRQGIRTPAGLEQKYGFGQNQREQEEINKRHEKQIKEQSTVFGAFKLKVEEMFKSITDSITKLSKAVDTLKQNQQSAGLSITNIVDSINELEKWKSEIESNADIEVVPSELLVNVYADSFDSEDLLADKSFNEIETAIEKDISVRAKFLNTTNGKIAFLYLASYIKGKILYFCGNSEGVQLVLRLVNAIVKRVTGNVISLSGSTDEPLEGLRIFGKTTQNGTPSPDAPVPLDSVGDDGSVAVTVCGKNLVNFPNTEPYVKNGITWSCKDGVVHAKGTSTATSSTGSLSVDIAGLAGTFTKSGSASYANLLCMVTKNGQTEWVGNTFTLDGSESTVLLYFQCAANVTLDIDLYPMLNVGEAALPYEPYKDGGSITISTPNGLPGIPVTSGGNYTDGNGQQWICDEVDFEKGVYVQRILQNVFNGSENWTDRTEAFTQKQDGQYRFALNNPFSVNYSRLDTKIESTYGLSDWGTVKGLHGIANKSADGFTLYTASQALYVGYITTSKYTSLEELKSGLSNNPLTVLAILETPIETALSAEQLAAFAALHTNYPNTTVFCDEGAEMEVKYLTYYS